MVSGENYEPKNNYHYLGLESLNIDLEEFYCIYKSEVLNYINDNVLDFPNNVAYFIVEYPGGNPELLYEREKYITKNKRH